jgi:hypothetical protein
MALQWYCFVGYDGVIASPVVAPSGVTYLAGFSYYAINTDVPLAHSTWPKFRCNPRNTGNVRDVGR